MASPEKIAPLLPETLPENFSDWDSEASPAPLPGNSGGWETWEAAHSFGKSPKPSGQSTDRDAILESLLGMPRASGSPSSAPVFAKRQKNLIEWDNKESPAATSVNRSEREPRRAGNSFSKSPKPLGQSPDRVAILESLLDRSRVSGSASPAPVSLKPQKLTSELVDLSPTSDASRTPKEVPVVPGLPNTASVHGMSNSTEVNATLRREANEALFEMFRSKNIEVRGEPTEPTTARKKWITVPVICACSILLPLILMVPLFHHGMKPATKQSVQPPRGASDTQPMPNTPPSASEPLTQDKLQVKTEGKQTTDNQPANKEVAVKSTQVPTEMMSDQLAAPTQIPQGIKKPVADNGPPPASFGAAGADGLGGNNAIDGVFKGQAQRAFKVANSKPLAISSGVAAGMLIQKMPTIYPAIAKSARVSGTVVLHAIISKTGTIKDLQVVSGPDMLRQAAVDSVRTWRYRPYKLNNEPTEIETTISVIFSLGG